MDCAEYFCRFRNPNIYSNLNYVCANVLFLRNLQEQAKKAFCFKNCTDHWPFTVRTILETKCHYFYVYKEFVKWLNLELYIVIYVTEKKYFVMISTFCMPIMIVNLQWLNNCFRRHEQTSIRLIQSCSIYVNINMLQKKSIL